MQNMNDVVAVLTAVVDAAAFSSVDKQKLVALVQSRPSSNDDDDELSAPVVVAWKSRNSNIVSPRRVKRCSQFLDAPAVS